jgi:nucleotide-binding universal stress UspA family protein
MFNDILVPLDGSELSERALPMAQNLAKSSHATVHLIHMISREHEFGVVSSTYTSATAMEMDMDMARRLTDSKLTRKNVHRTDRVSTQ